MCGRRRPHSLDAALAWPVAGKSAGGKRGGCGGGREREKLAVLERSSWAERNKAVLIGDSLDA